MPRGVYQRMPYMKNMKHEQTVRIEKMLDIGMNRREICRALQVSVDVVAMVIHRRNKENMKLADDLNDGVLSGD